MASNSQTFTVVGFQYEPARFDKSQPQVGIYDDDDDKNDDTIYADTENNRTATNLHEWCKCGQCKPMPSQKECLCCTEIDEVKYFHLIGKRSLIQISPPVLFCLNRPT